MSNLRKMIDAIDNEDFNGAKCALKASLAEYMAGKKYLSNKDIFGDRYNNPNDEEQELKLELTESIDVGEMADKIFAIFDAGDTASKKLSLKIWVDIENALGDSKINTGDATPEELIQKLGVNNPHVIETLYTKYVMGKGA